jgi:hypothetical protein
VRLELDSGDWIDIAERLNYAQAIRINRALGTPEGPGELVAAVVLRWALRDVVGEPIECPPVEAAGIPSWAIDRMPFDVFQQVTVVAADLLSAEPDPKGSAARLRGSKTAAGSRSRKTSPTRTSSSITPDGPGTISDLRRPA